MQKKFTVFAQNLAYYNEGKLVGGWIDLPQPIEKIEEYLKNVVKVDDEHEEYEIADIDEVGVFPYASIQWADLGELNNLAIIYNNLNEFQKKAIGAYLIYYGEEHYDINELINLCLQADSIEYYNYSFVGIENCKNYSPELKFGYTLAEETGLYDSLDKQGIVNYFDFEKYGEDMGMDYELLENGYIYQDSELDLELYSQEEIDERVNSCVKEAKELEEETIEI